MRLIIVMIDLLEIVGVEMLAADRAGAQVRRAGAGTRQFFKIFGKIGQAAFRSYQAGALQGSTAADAQIVLSAQCQIFARKTRADDRLSQEITEL